MSPPNEQQTPTKRIGGEDGARGPGRDGGVRTHTKFRDAHQKDYQSLSLNGGEAAKDVMILSLQRRLNTSSTEVKVNTGGQQIMDARNGSPSRFEDNKGRLEMISSRNQDMNSTKKNLFVQEF